MCLSSLVLMCLIYPDSCTVAAGEAVLRQSKHSGGDFGSGAVGSAAYTSRKDIVFSLLPS